MILAVSMALNVACFLYLVARVLRWRGRRVVFKLTTPTGNIVARVPGNEMHKIRTVGFTFKDGEVRCYLATWHKTDLVDDVQIASTSPDWCVGTFRGAPRPVPRPPNRAARRRGDTSHAEPQRRPPVPGDGQEHNVVYAAKEKEEEPC